MIAILLNLIRILHVIVMREENMVVEIFMSINTSRKQGFGPGRVSPLVPVQSRTGTHGALVPVREARGLSGLVGALVPVRLAPLVPVGGTNRDQWASLLAHHHWSRLVA